MNRIILLDSGPLGMVTNPKATGTPLDCQLWLKFLLRRGERFAVKLQGTPDWSTNNYN